MEGPGFTPGPEVDAWRPSHSSVSSSWKMRSLAAIAPCITAYFCERSRTGMKNLLMYSMNTTTTPIMCALLAR